MTILIYDEGRFIGDIAGKEWTRAQCPHCGGTDCFVRSSFGPSIARRMRITCKACKKCWTVVGVARKELWYLEIGPKGAGV
jgi:hypothetical protein